MSRQEFDRKTKAEIALRATDANGVLRCEECKCAIKGRKFEVDHILADGLKPTEDKARKLTAKDGQLLCIPCHALKTPGDVAKIAKAKRCEGKHLGITPAPARKLQGQGFALSAKTVERTGREKKPTLPPRQIYEDV